MCSRHRAHKTASYWSSQSNAKVTAFRWGRRRLVRSSKSDPGFVFPEPQRRESHCQQRELSAALQATSTASFSGDITMSASIGSTDHPQMTSCFKSGHVFYRFHFSIRREANPGIPVRLNICRTRRLLAAHCAALILPTFFLRLAKAFFGPILGGTTDGSRGDGFTRD